MNQPPLMSNEIKCKQAKGYSGEWPTFYSKYKMGLTCAQAVLFPTYSEHFSPV